MQMRQGLLLYLSCITDLQRIVHPMSCRECGEVELCWKESQRETSCSTRDCNFTEPRFTLDNEVSTEFARLLGLEEEFQ